MRVPDSIQNCEIEIYSKVTHQPKGPNKMQYFAPRLIEAHGPHSYTSDFDFSIEPYSGCNFGCAYCFVPHKTKYVEETSRWGKWRKNQDTEGLSAEPLLKLNGAKILLAGRTDAWQPIEKKRQITRDILIKLVDQPFQYLMASTRSSLIERDLDLFEAISHKTLVSISINTDDSKLTTATEPLAPLASERLRVARRLATLGIPVRIAVAPVMRHTSSFFEMLMEVVPHVWIDEPDPDAVLRPEIAELIYTGSRLLNLLDELRSRFGNDRISFGRDAFSGHKFDELGILQ